MKRLFTSALLTAVAVPFLVAAPAAKKAQNSTASSTDTTATTATKVKKTRKHHKKVSTTEQSTTQATAPQGK